VVSGQTDRHLKEERIEALADDSDEMAGREPESIDSAAAAIQTASRAAGLRRHEGITEQQIP